MKLTPILAKVLVRLDATEQTFGDSCLVRPDIAAEKPMWGEVIAVGAGRISRTGKRIKPTLHRGDRVCVPWATGHDMIIGGSLCVAVPENEILAVEER